MAENFIFYVLKEDKPNVKEQYLSFDNDNEKKIFFEKNFVGTGFILSLIDSL